MQAQWEKAIDNILLPAIDEVMNIIYKESKIGCAPDIDYIKHCTGFMNKKASAYIASKSNALIEYGLNAEPVLQKFSSK